MYVERAQTSRLKRLVEVFPLVVVTGARQVGKSTLLKQLFGDTFETVVFDPAVDVGNARKDPELFLDNHPAPLILDEIQYAPELLGVLKRRIDLDRHPGQYILTGSQQWGVLKSVSESLAGRAVFLDLWGFSTCEINKQVARKSWLEMWMEGPESFPVERVTREDSPRTLYEQMWRGWLPEAQVIPIDVVPDFHLAYRRTYLERDVRLLLSGVELQTFGRFISLAAGLSAQEINYSQLGRELSVTPQTAGRWLDVLKNTYQWFEIPAFSRNVLKRLSGRPKGYLSDTGQACSSQFISSPSALGGNPLTGHLFESMVVAELQKLASLMGSPPSFHHWRTHAGAEVDVLLERDGMIFPIEIKMTSRPSRADLRGLNAFRETYPSLRIAPALVLAPVEGAFKISETDYAFPWNAIVKEVNVGEKCSNA
jgi:predicted AAA+ superfamily ATPase